MLLTEYSCPSSLNFPDSLENHISFHRKPHLKEPVLWPVFEKNIFRLQIISLTIAPCISSEI